VNNKIMETSDRSEPGYYALRFTGKHKTNTTPQCNWAAGLEYGQRKERNKAKLS
jgi:hypothetical protein